jgi:PHYB activation tagged suppressor 1
MAGRVFLYWFGSTPNICVADYAMAKQVLADRTGLFPKNRMNANMLRLLGEGLVLANGDDWQRHKKVVHPAFNMDKLKVSTPWQHGRASKHFHVLVLSAACLVCRFSAC